MMLSSSTTKPFGAHPHPASNSSNSIHMMKDKLRNVLHALEDLRLEYLHSAIGGLPMPTTHQLEALARLRPSSELACPNSCIPTWSTSQTSMFGEIFLDRLWEASKAQGLPLDAYVRTAGEHQYQQQQAPLDTSKQPHLVLDVVGAFNRGQLVGDIARSRSLDEVTVLRLLLEVDEKQSQTINWTRMALPFSGLLDAVAIAVEVARHLEKAAVMVPGQPRVMDPLSPRFPLACLMQLLPDLRPADVLAAICCLRQQPGQQQRHRQGGKSVPPPTMIVNNSSGAKRLVPTAQDYQQPQQRQPLASLPQPLVPPPPQPQAPLHIVKQPPQPQQQHQQKPYAPCAAAAAPPAVVVPLDQQILALLQTHAAQGLSPAECCQLLFKTTGGGGNTTTQQAVVECLGGLEESYVAYRGADGKFKLL